MKDTQEQTILSTFQERGWVDLDRILELLSKKIAVKTSTLTETTKNPNTSQDTLKRKITALMELADLTNHQRKQLIEKCKSSEQLQQLHSEWEEKIKTILGVALEESEIPHSAVPQVDYSKYQSGKKEKIFRFSEFKALLPKVI